ncbi:MAG: hypothetical protein ACREQV_03295, partial [Candidatus Binatia bacterium]
MLLARKKYLNFFNTDRCAFKEALAAATQLRYLIQRVATEQMRGYTCARDFYHPESFDVDQDKLREGSRPRFFTPLRCV